MLKVVDLSNSHLGGHIPASMAKLVNLEDLDLSHCQLMGAGMGDAIPPGFGKLSKMKQFILDHNRITGVLPPKVPPPPCPPSASQPPLLPYTIPSFSASSA